MNKKIPKLDFYDSVRYLKNENLVNRIKSDFDRLDFGKQNNPKFNVENYRDLLLYFFEEWNKNKKDCEKYKMMLKAKICKENKTSFSNLHIYELETNKKYNNEEIDLISTCSEEDLPF